MREPHVLLDLLDSQMVRVGILTPLAIQGYCLDKR